ncbi:hypothetical protein [Coleofasciculus sp. FACHB-712]|uniref:hypothetical protein n=1 Tax=Coleofasciculus sp. FACHB-712 TaxID=2692789 RepID=UPI001688F304|nr:hypothetical protein [Coleofasciculus sp. FACHB-712]
METLRDRNSRHISITTNLPYKLRDREALLLTADRAKTFCKVVIDKTPEYV